MISQSLYPILAKCCWMDYEWWISDYSFHNTKFKDSRFPSLQSFYSRWNRCYNYPIWKWWWIIKSRYYHSVLKYRWIAMNLSIFSLLYLNALFIDFSIWQEGLSLFMCKMMWKFFIELIIKCLMGNIEVMNNFWYGFFFILKYCRFSVIKLSSQFFQSLYDISW